MLGLSITVAPLTAAVLGGIEPEHAGVGSAVNNAVARIAGLLGVAAVAVISGGALDIDGTRRAMLAAAVLLFIGGVVSAIGITNAASVGRRGLTVRRVSSGPHHGLPDRRDIAGPVSAQLTSCNDHP